MKCLLFSREKIALDEPRTEKQNREKADSPLTTNHIVNVLLENGQPSGQKSTMMAAPKPASKTRGRTTRKPKIEGESSQTSTESTQENKGINKSEIREENIESGPGVNIPDIVRKLQHAAHEKNNWNVLCQYNCVPPPQITHPYNPLKYKNSNMILTHHQLLPPPCYPVNQPVMKTAQPVMLQTPVQVHHKSIPYLQNNVHTTRSDNWSTTPTSTSTSISTYNNQKYKNTMKNFTSEPNIR